MRHQGAHLLRAGAHPGQRVDRAAAAGEDVDRTGPQRADDQAQVRRVLVGDELAVAGGEPMSSGGVPSARVPCTSYVIWAPGASMVWVVVEVMIGSFVLRGARGSRTEDMDRRVAQNSSEVLPRQPA